MSPGSMEAIFCYCYHNIEPNLYWHSTVLGFEFSWDLVWINIPKHSSDT